MCIYKKKKLCFLIWDKKKFWFKYFNLKEEKIIFLIFDKKKFELIF